MQETAKNTNKSTNKIATKQAFLNQLYESVAVSIKESMEMPAWTPKNLQNFDVSAQEFQNYTAKIKAVRYFLSFLRVCRVFAFFSRLVVRQLQKAAKTQGIQPKTQRKPDKLPTKSRKR